MHTLTKLTYPFDALEPYIDARTMEIHQTKHHQGYVDKLNAALESYPELQRRSVVDLLANIDEIPADIRTAVRNHGGGHANHNLYFTVMGPQQGGEPRGKLAEQIQAVFGGFAPFRQQFSDVALGRFGSGWAWLTVDADGELQVESTANQDSPLMFGRQPLLGLDVWEHAYYLKYQNRRAEYVDAWWNVVDWEHVNNILELAGTATARA